jgi:hypothetical protein
MPDFSSIWAIVTIVGPLVLGLALLYGVMHSRRRTRRGAQK